MLSKHFKMKYVAKDAAYKAAFASDSNLAVLQQQSKRADKSGHANRSTRCFAYCKNKECPTEDKDPVLHCQLRQDKCVHSLLSLHILSNTGKTQELQHSKSFWLEQRQHHLPCMLRQLSKLHENCCQRKIVFSACRHHLHVRYG